MAAPLPHAQPTTGRLSLTVHITADSDRLPALTESLVTALRALSAQGVAETVSVTETPTRTGVVVPLPAKRTPLRVLADSRRVLWRGREVALTRLEYDLLLFLATHPKHVHRRRALMSEVWRTSYVSERTIDVHIRRLRGKIDPDAPLIRTVRGVGYQFGDPGLVTIEQAD